MAFQSNISAPRDSEFREVFHNCYVTGFSISALLSMGFCLIFGVIFSAVLLFFICYIALALLYIVFGLNPLNIKDEIPIERPSIGSIIEGIIAFLVWLAFFAYLGPHSLIRFKRRLSSRLYVLAGRPLASVEGKPTFEPDSECGFNGIEIREFYFDFEDCQLNIDYKDLEKLQRAGGVMRAWYIPSGMREWNNPNTGKTVKYNCLLVYAEWRPVY